MDFHGSSRLPVATQDLVVQERRVDPDDGMAYTWDELVEARTWFMA